MKKKVCFVLSRPTKRIVGGYKVVYDYANYLNSQGWNVIVCYDCSEIGNRFNLKNGLIKKALGKIMKYRAKWVMLEKNIHISYIGSPKDIKKLDKMYVIATAQNTSKTVELCKSANKYYFIQGKENWGISEAELVQTYRYDMKRIVISSWLYDYVGENSNYNKLYLCKNGVDLEMFKINHDIEKRKNDSIAFMYHEEEGKGVELLLPILKKLKKKYLTLTINAFGSYRMNSKLDFVDKYIEYANQSQIVELYNESAIFVCSSWEEGYGLTGLESMCCGCALLTTETNGSKEYSNKENAYIVNPGDSNAIYDGLCYLIDNPEKRIKIAKNGNKDIQKFDIKDARKKFEKILTEC